jgi:hypothetical protein
VNARAALFNDAGGGPGTARLGVLEARGVAAATVSAESARIGDGRSTFADGISRPSTLSPWRWVPAQVSPPPRSRSWCWRPRRARDEPAHDERRPCGGRDAPASWRRSDVGDGRLPVAAFLRRGARNGPRAQPDQRRARRRVCCRCLRPPHRPARRLRRHTRSRCYQPRHGAGGVLQRGGPARRARGRAAPWPRRQAHDAGDAPA